MATNVSICSAALLQLGKEPINDFNEDNDRARLCSNLYPIERESLLRENDWNCSLQRVLLAPLTMPPAYGFSASFALPGDFLRLVSVGDHRVGTPNCRAFKVEGRNILASGTVLPITYVFRSDESVWDGKLVELMTARMLWKLAYPVTASTSLRDELRGEYQRLAAMARAVDAQENPGEELGDDYPLLAARS